MTVWNWNHLNIQHIIFLASLLNTRIGKQLQQFKNRDSLWFFKVVNFTFECNVLLAVFSLTPQIWGKTTVLRITYCYFFVVVFCICFRWILLTNEKEPVSDYFIKQKHLIKKCMLTQLVQCHLFIMVFFMHQLRSYLEK